MCSSKNHSIQQYTRPSILKVDFNSENKLLEYSQWLSYKTPESVSFKKWEPETYISEIILTSKTTTN